MKIFLIILFSLLGLIALILLLLSLLVRLRVDYSQGSFSVRVGALCFFKTLYPEKKKLPDPGKEEKKKAKKLKKMRGKSGKKIGGTAKKAKKGTGTNALELFSFLREIAEQVLFPAAEKLGRLLHVKIRRLRVMIASEDAAHTAQTYGLVIAAAASLEGWLQNFTVLKLPGKKEDLQIIVRYDITQPEAVVRIEIALRPLPAALSLLPEIMKFFELKEKNNRKNKEVPYGIQTE